MLPPKAARAECVERIQPKPITENQVVADDLGNAIVVWLQNDGTQQKLRTTRYSSNDGDWEPATFLEENDSGDAYRPHLVVHRATGAAMVVRFQRDGSNRDIWAIDIGGTEAHGRGHT